MDKRLVTSQALALLGAPENAAAVMVIDRDENDGIVSINFHAGLREVWAMADTLITQILDAVEQDAEPLCGSCQPFLDRLTAAKASLDRPGLAGLLGGRVH